MSDRTRVRGAGEPVGTYRALAALAGDGQGEIDEAAVTELLAFADSRRDCSDFRMICVLRLILAAGDRMSERLRDRVRRSVTGFKYWMDAPGADAICYWSENHQVLFATAEFLAGTLYPDDVFLSDRRTGADHRIAAEQRLHRWLELRFRHGFSEWLSGVYYTEDVAALTVLIDHAGDRLLQTRATMVLDLLLLDAALHAYEGTLAASSGRLYEAEKKHPAQADLQLVLDAAFTDRELVAEWNSLGMLFCLRDGYEVPAVLREIADAPGPFTVRTSHGLDVAEALRVFENPMDPETTGALLWGMEAFVHPQAVRTTMRAYEVWGMQDNPFLSDLSQLSRIPRPLLPLAIKVLNPSVQGTTLERADVVTYRTADYQLSSAQHYRPGGFGDQQHIWQLLLPGGVSIFGTHPGAALVENATRQRTPNAWVGNGVNPAVAQDRGTLLALYDTRGRRGWQERPRAKYSHLYVPFDELDEVSLSGTRLFVRKGDALVAILGVSPLDRRTDEVVQKGAVTGWAVICSDTRTAGSLAEFDHALIEANVTLAGDELRLTSPNGVFSLSAGESRLDGRLLAGPPFLRYDAPWVQAERGADQIVVVGSRERLVLDWSTGRGQVDR